MGGVEVNLTILIARLVKTATPLVLAFDLAVLAVHAASWTRWVRHKLGGGDPRPSFGIKKHIATGRHDNIMTDACFGYIFGAVIN